MSAGAAAPGRTFARAFALAWWAAGWMWVASLALSCVAGLLVPVAAWFSRELIDDLTASHRNPGHVVLLAVAVAASGILSALSGSLSGLLSSTSQRSISVMAAQRLYQALNRMPGIACFEDPSYQDELRQAEQASQETPVTLCNLLLAVLQTVFTTAGFAGALLLIWPPLPLVLLAMLVPSVLAERALGRSQAALNAAAMADFRRYGSYQFLLASPQAAKEIRLLRIGDFLLGKMMDAYRNATKKQLSGHRQAFRVQAFVSCLIGATVAATAGYVAYQAAVGRVSVGDFVLFTAAVASAQGSASSLLPQASMLLASLTRFRSYLEILRQARRSGRRQHAGPAALAWHRIRQRLVPLWRGQGLGAQGPDHVLARWAVRRHCRP